MLKPVTPQAFKLLMDGAEAMTRIEAAGIRIDESYLKKCIADTERKIETMDRAIADDPIYTTWTQVYGNATKLGSRAQLGKVIFDVLGYKRNPYLKKTKKRFQPEDEDPDSNNAAAFEHLKLDFIRNWQDVERLKKALATNLKGILRETVDGYMHPFFSLNNVESYRSASQMPNLQNQPIRNKDISQIVRSCMIPRKGNVFLEPDLETHEVRISYCYNQDPKLLYDVMHGDMHRDRAKDIYMLSDEQLGTNEDKGKLTRYVVKNRFVFAEFYGSVFFQCAPTLWDAISIFDIKTAQGKSMYEHLASKGIKELGLCEPGVEPVKGTFEYHVWKVEQKMWDKKYKVYKQWKYDWWDLYVANCGVNYKTGFVLEGVFKRNQILCDPIQGSAFHCLLWTIIEAQKMFRKYKMKTKIVTQIHDSMLLDTPEREINQVVEIVGDIILRRLPKAWPWIISPLAMGFDICHENWFKKEPLKLEGMSA